jgi:chromosome segregation ATPase
MIDFPTLVSGLGIIAGFALPLVKIFANWVNDLRSSNQVLQSNIGNLSADLLKERQARLDAESKTNTLQRDVKFLENDRNRLELERKADAERYEQFKQAMQDQIDTLYNRLATMETAFNQKIQEQQDKIDSQADKIRSLNAQISTLSEQLTAKQAHIAKLSEEIAIKNGTIEQQRFLIASKDEEIITLQTQKTELEKAVAELQAKVDQIPALIKQAVAESMVELSARFEQRIHELEQADKPAEGEPQ